LKSLSSLKLYRKDAEAAESRRKKTLAKYGTKNISPHDFAISFFIFLPSIFLPSLLPLCVSLHLRGFFLCVLGVSAPLR
jgi:hypothetical protein